jgi:PhzF family phenazine biosynthesis protein
MKLDVFYIDAFSKNVFSGNPAAVIFSDLDDETTMQKIAAENNLSETAFINQKDGINNIRWFSPTTEVNLCGHATLASGYVYFNFINKNENKIIFSSASGTLVVENKDTFLELDFPKDKFNEVNYIDEVEDSIGIKPINTYLGEINLFAVMESEEDIKNINPDFDKVLQLEGQGLIVSSKSEDVDFVSRYFCPKYGINEDPVTGSAHTTLIPYWADKLNKTSMTAKQISNRGGILYCTNLDDRVLIGGQAVLYMKGEIDIS